MLPKPDVIDGDLWLYIGPTHFDTVIDALKQGRYSDDVVHLFALTDFDFIMSLFKAYTAIGHNFVLMNVDRYDMIRKPGE